MKYVVNYLCLIFLFLCPPSYAQHRAKHVLPAPKTYRVQVGDALVKVLYYRGKGKTFVHVHQNEKTALRAAKTVILKQGGSLITIVHKGGRNVVFHIKKSRYEFDPNRIFTREGIKKTLRRYSHYSPAAYTEVNKLAKLLKAITN